MTIEEMAGVIEAILFSVGTSVPLSTIANAMDMDKGPCRKVLNTIKEKYEKENRGIQLVEFDGAYQLCTKPDYYEYVIKVVNQPKKHVLTDVVLETLSIIAYKQPITRGEIEAIRGVKSDHAINRLIEYDFVQEVGRLDAPGRPILFGTTEEFLRCFGVQSIDELPIIHPTKVEDFKHEAEEEIKVSLGI